MNLNPSAKRILCYGDSYTWGYIPGTDHERYPITKRWTGILQQLLGDSYEVIEEGLNSRTLKSDDTRPNREGRNGSTYLIPCLDSHDPIDLVILMLGTNELKDRFNSSSTDIARTIEDDYLKVILNRKSQFRNATPKLLLISPPALNLTMEYAHVRYSQSQEKVEQLSIKYQELVDKYNIAFIDGSKTITVGNDGVHLNEENNKKLAEVIEERIKSLA